MDWSPSAIYLEEWRIHWPSGLACRRPPFEAASRASFHKSIERLLMKIPTAGRQAPQQVAVIHEPLGDQMHDLPLPLHNAQNTEQS